MFTDGNMGSTSIKGEAIAKQPRLSPIGCVCSPFCKDGYIKPVPKGGGHVG